MAQTYDELKHKTVAELREIAKATEHEAVKGYTQMNKDHLLQALCKALGIDAHLHRHHHAAGEQRTKTKARIRALRNADSVNDLRLAIKLHSKEAKNRDITKGIEHLDIVK